MRLIALGGALEVGASCYVLETDNSRVVIDCGMRMLDVREGIKAVEAPALGWLDGKRVDAVVFTHGHLDHTGAGPAIAARHPEARLISTLPTKLVAELMLADALKVAEKTYTVPLFNKEELASFLARLEGVRNQDWFGLGGGLTAKLWPSGHIRGAASILLKTPEGNVMFSGDVSFQDAPTIKGATLPDDFQPDILILEATNGAVILPPRQETEAALVEKVRSVQARGGHVLLPTFALGRTQDVMLVLARAGIRSQTGGLGQKILRLFSQPDSIWCGLDQPVSLPSPNLGSIRDWDHAVAIANSDWSKVLAVPAGWLEGGWARAFAKAWVEDEKNAIIFSGWVKPESPAHRLINTPRGGEIWLDSEKFRVEAEVCHFRLSGHADQAELTRWIEALKPAVTVLVHGDPGTLDVFHSHLQEQGLRSLILEKETPLEF